MDIYRIATHELGGLHFVPLLSTKISVRQMRDMLEILDVYDSIVEQNKPKPPKPPKNKKGE